MVFGLAAVFGLCSVVVAVVRGSINPCDMALTKRLKKKELPPVVFSPLIFGYRGRIGIAAVRIPRPIKSID
ncbi:MAG: hypothetical protein QNJ04_05250 [Desulfobacterales bacterium]|nr:hypothetical protein [Desulfobacterales bacterium]